MTGLGNCNYERCSEGIWCKEPTHRTCTESVDIDNARFSCNKFQLHKGKHQSQGDFPVRFTLKWREM